MLKSKYYQPRYIQHPLLKVQPCLNSIYFPINHPVSYIMNSQILPYPLDSQNVLSPPSNIPQNTNTPIISDDYIQPLGSRHPIEKNHHPYKIISPPPKVEKNNSDEENEEEKKEEIKHEPLVLLGQKYQINEYVDILRKILDNIGTDEESIITIIENTYFKERQSIRKMYNQKYNENLISRFQKELTGDFKESVIGSFMQPTEYDAYCLHNSMKGMGTKEGILTEIIGSRKNAELKSIKQFYVSNYGETLKNDVGGETYGDYQKFLLALLQCHRSTSSQPNTNACANDASDLFKLGEKKRGTDEETFIRIFTKSSPVEIAFINHFYKQQTGKGLLGAIESEFEFSGDTKDLLDTIVRVQVDHYGYYANTIHESIESGNNAKLIRNICSRYTVDLSLIRRAYMRDYQYDMLEDIQTKITSNFGKVIYSLASKLK